MKILVTGAKGFVGKNLCAQLRNIADGKAKCYGNIEIDSDARKNLLEETLRTLQNSPDNIISHLKTIKEDLECDENFENDKEYQETKELINEIEKLKAEQIDESLEI